MHRLLQFCEDHTASLRRTIEELVAHESPSHDKAAVDRCGAALARMLTSAGAAVSAVRQQERGDHLMATFPGGDGQILVLGHFDTVWPVGTLERMPLKEEAGRLHGPGIFDMKAGIAVAILAATATSRRPAVTMLLTTDEEIGSQTSRALIERQARQSDAVLVMEPSLPGGAVKTRRKGCGEFVLTARGVAAHAGIDPGKGASAVHEIARQIVDLQRLSDPARGISVNVGVVRGGTRGNVIAEEATAVIDVRVASMRDAAGIESVLRSLQPHNPAVSLEIAGGVERPPLERSAAVARLYEEAVAAARELGRDLEEGGTGGGSDGNFTAALGVPTLDGLGPQGDGAHALHEHVVLADLPWRAALMARLMERLGGVK